jgi:hypothetical protein
MEVTKTNITLICIFLTGLIIFYVTSKIIQILTPFALVILIYFLWKHK